MEKFEEKRMVPVVHHELKGGKPEDMAMVKVVDLQKILQNSTSALSEVTTMNKKIDGVVAKTDAAYDMIKSATTRTSDGNTTSSEKAASSRSATKRSNRGLVTPPNHPSIVSSGPLISRWMTHQNITANDHLSASSSSTDQAKIIGSTPLKNSTPTKVDQSYLVTKQGVVSRKKRNTVVAPDQSRSGSSDDDSIYISDDGDTPIGQRRKSARIVAPVNYSDAIPVSPIFNQTNYLDQTPAIDKRFAALQKDLRQKDQLKLQSLPVTAQQSMSESCRNDDEDILNTYIPDEDDADPELRAALKVSWEHHLMNLGGQESKNSEPIGPKSASIIAVTSEGAASSSKVSVEDFPGARIVNKVKGGVLVSWNGDINDGQPINPAQYRRHLNSILEMRKMASIEELWGSNPRMPTQFYFEAFGAIVNRVCLDQLGGLKTNSRIFIEGISMEEDDYQLSMVETIERLPEPIKIAIKTATSIFFKKDNSEEIRNAYCAVVKAAIEECKTFLKIYDRPGKSK